MTHFSHNTESSHECNWSKESELHVRTKLYIASKISIDVPYGLVEKAVKSIVRFGVYTQSKKPL